MEVSSKTKKKYERISEDNVRCLVFDSEDLLCVFGDIFWYVHEDYLLSCYCNEYLRLKNPIILVVFFSVRSLTRFTDTVLEILKKRQVLVCWIIFVLRIGFWLSCFKGSTNFTNEYCKKKSTKTWLSVPAKKEWYLLFHPIDETWARDLLSVRRCIRWMHSGCYPTGFETVLRDTRKSYTFLSVITLHDDVPIKNGWRYKTPSDDPPSKSRWKGPRYSRL